MEKQRVVEDEKLKASVCTAKSTRVLTPDL